MREHLTQLGFSLLALITAGPIKEAGLGSAGCWKNAARLSQNTGHRLLCSLGKLLKEVLSETPVFSVFFQEASGKNAAKDHSMLWLKFPPLCLNTAMGDNEEESAALLSLRGPLNKSLYTVDMMVFNKASLAGA